LQGYTDLFCKDILDGMQGYTQNAFIDLTLVSQYKSSVLI